MKRDFRLSLVMAALLMVLGTWVGVMNSQEKKEPPALAGDFGKELPRVPARTASESQATMEMVDGFRVEVVAQEPAVVDPVAVDFDAWGRMFVIQLPGYNAYGKEGATTGGSIVLLEDTNGDGKYEKSTLYADDFKYPTALACWDGGLFVGDSPDLLYLKDDDGDGKADQRKVVFTGFGGDKAGEAYLNSIRWGMDNRFHLSTSLSGGDVKAVGKDPTSVRGRGMIFDPRDLSGFELTSGGGQHGMSMDDWGRKFVCSNSVPAQTLMYDDRYVARNPQLKAAAAAVNIAPGGKYTKLFRISPPEPWRVLRTRLRKEGKFRGSDEGGKPFGFFTGATGITIYRGDAWPKSYRGNLLVGDVANNLVYRATLKKNDLGLVAERADQEAEFLASQDIWFRPVQFANAPDGNLYMLDMCREMIEGVAFLPPEFFKYLDAVSGNDRGRIYRIVSTQTKSAARVAPKLGGLSSADLVPLLQHPNGWHRDVAARVLYQRQDRSVVRALEKMVVQASTPQGRATALHVLHGLASLKEEVALAALSDSSPDVRVQALRVAENLVAESAIMRDRVVQMTSDSDAEVRYQLAFSLGAVATRGSVAAIAKLAVENQEDSWMQMAILSSLGQGAEQAFDLLVANAAYRATGAGRSMLVALAGQIGANGRNSEIAVVLNTLEPLRESDKSLSEALVKALVEKQKGAKRERILAAAGGQAAAILKQVVKEARLVAADSKAETTRRVDAIRSLRLGGFSDQQKLFAELLQLSQPQPVQAATLEVVGGYQEAGVASLVLNVWKGLSPQLRNRAAETVLSRPEWVDQFLDSIEAGQVARSDIDPSRVQLLKQHPQKEIAQRVEKIFTGTRLSTRTEVVQRYQPALKKVGDVTRGKLVFKKNCSACHRLESVGNAIGADLEGVRQRGLAAVMLNILDPNREVKPRYLTYIVETTEGRILTGMIASETANSLTIRRVDGTTVSVLRVEIEDLRSTGLSFMPEGLEKMIDAEAMADLLSYLDSIQ